MELGFQKFQKNPEFFFFHFAKAEQLSSVCDGDCENTEDQRRQS